MELGDIPATSSSGGTWMAKASLAIMWQARGKEPTSLFSNYGTRAIKYPTPATVTASVTLGELRQPMELNNDCSDKSATHILSSSFGICAARCCAVFQQQHLQRMHFGDIFQIHIFDGGGGRSIFSNGFYVVREESTVTRERYIQHSGGIATPKSAVFPYATM